MEYTTMIDDRDFGAPEMPTDKDVSEIAAEYIALAGSKARAIQRIQESDYPESVIDRVVSTLSTVEG